MSKRIVEIPAQEAPNSLIKALKAEGAKEPQDSLVADSIDLMPSCKLDLPLSLLPDKIIGVFKDSAERNNFQVTNDFPSVVTVSLKKSSCLRRLFRCFIPLPDDLIDTTAGLNLGINEAQGLRSIYLKGLSGNPFPISSLIQDFSSEVSRLASGDPSSLHLETEEEDGFFVTCKNESSSYYEFCKILSSDSNALGRSVAQFIDEFNEDYQYPEDSLEHLPSVVTSLRAKIEATVVTLFCDYNSGRKPTEKIMLYCRPTVEKYIFSRLYPTLIEIYRLQSLATDSRFRAQQALLKASCLYSSLEIPAELRVPFSQSVEQLNRLETLSSPAEKLNCFIGMIADANSEVLEHSSGQLEIPRAQESRITAYLLLKSKVTYPQAEIQFLHDWEVRAEKAGILQLVQDSVSLINSL